MVGLQGKVCKKPSIILSNICQNHSLNSLQLSPTWAWAAAVPRALASFVPQLLSVLRSPAQWPPIWLSRSKPAWRLSLRYIPPREHNTDRCS